MMHRALGLVFLLAAGAFLNASQASPYAQALQKVVDSFETIGKSLTTIVDEDSAKAAKPDLRKSAQTFLEARAKAAKMLPPEKDEKARLEKQFKPKLEEAMKKMFTQIRRVELIPGGKDALKEIAGVLKKDGK